MALRARSTAHASAARGLLLVGALGAAGCDGSFVSLGASGDALNGSGATAGSAMLAGSGGGLEGWDVAPQPVIAQEPDLLLSYPTLTADQQRLFFTEQERFGNPDPNPARVMQAVRSGASFDTAKQVTLPKDAFGYASPAISADGSELWLSRLSELNGVDIWRCVAQGGDWSEPEPVPELSSPFDDIARPPALGGSLMALSSKRHGGLYYQVYLSTRGVDGTWSEPNQDHVSGLNSADFLSADGFLNADGLALYFASRRTGSSDLYVARRASVNADFGEPEPLVGVNTDHEERAPWVSPDERTLYFASDRENGGLEQYAIYVATRR